MLFIPYGVHYLLASLFINGIVSLQPTRLLIKASLLTEE